MNMMAGKTKQPNELLRVTTVFWLFEFILIRLNVDNSQIQGYFQNIVFSVLNGLLKKFVRVWLLILI